MSSETNKHEGTVASLQRYRRLHIDGAPEIIYYDAGLETDHPFWQAAARREWRVADAPSALKLDPMNAV